MQTTKVRLLLKLPMPIWCKGTNQYDTQRSSGIYVISKVNRHFFDAIDNL